MDPGSALRLSIGGAIVIFSTYDTASWVASSSSAALPAQPSGTEANYVPPAFVVKDLGLTSVPVGTRLTAAAIDRVLASVQPRGVGFIDVLVAAYDRLLAQDGCPEDEAEAVLGDTRLVQALTDRGMAHVRPHSPADPAKLQPAAPALAPRGVLVDLQTRLAHDQELLLDGNRRLAGAQARSAS